MKALVLCGGKGSRLWPITLSMPKQLIPLAGKPILSYIIDSLIEADITEIGIIVNEEKDSFNEVIDRYIKKGVKIVPIKQIKPLGLANAVLHAEDFIREEDFIMILGDNIYDLNIESFVQRFKATKSNCQILLKEVSEPERFGIAEITDGEIIDLKEKPKNPASNLAITGIYVFDNKIFASCSEIEPSLRGEYEITDAIRNLMQKGYKITYEITQKRWKDLGKPEDILEANQYELSRKSTKLFGFIDDQSKYDGNIVLEKKSYVLRSIIKGPVFIDSNVTIEDSIIGPNVSIYNNTSITKCRIENSIVLEDCTLANIPYTVKNSFIANSSIIEGENVNSEAINILVGRNSRIIIT